MIKVLYIAVGDSYGSGKALLNVLKSTSFKNVEPYIIISKKLGLENEIDTLKIPFEVINLKFEILPKYRSTIDILFLIPRILNNIQINYIGKNKLIRLCKQLNPDIIHTNIGVFRVGYKVSKALSIPHVWHIREYQDTDMGYLPLGGKNYLSSLLKRKNNFPIAITKGIFEHFSMNHKARIIYDGVRENKQINFISKKSKYFLFVGNICQHKGVDQIIKAFIRFLKDNCDYTLHIVGEVKDKYSSILLKNIIDQGLNDKILFLGFRNDVDILMANATALIVASSSEGFGFTTAEAMFNGCLVIGKDCAGTKEQFDNGYALCENEIAVRYKTENDLVNAMQTIVKNGINYYFPIIQRSQKTVSSLYSTENCAENIIKLYQEIL
ncbi:hypothetical protein GCM10028818_05380 [Spirosoma horti]